MALRIWIRSSIRLRAGAAAVAAALVAAGLSATAALASSPPAAQCPALALRLGPTIELNSGDEAYLDRDHEKLEVESDGEVSIYDLDRDGAAASAAPLRSASTSGPVVTGRQIGSAAAPAAVAPPRPGRLELKDQTIALPNGRTLWIARIYVDTYLIQVGASDAAAYRDFGRDLRAGRACGRPFAALTPALTDALRPSVRYFLYESQTRGALDDYASWIAYSPIFKAFLTIPQTEDLLEIYGYRASEQGRAIPELAQLDPDKLWTFAWNAAARLFHDRDFTEFSDLSSYQRDGRIAFDLLGWTPLDGGRANKYGFYTKPLAVVPTTSISSTRTLHWSWRDGDTDYAGAVTLHPPQPAVTDPPHRFPGLAHRGLLVIDGTFDQKDVRDLLPIYRRYFEASGYRFAPQRSVSNVARFVASRIRTLDYLVRDGHSDGDDAHLMVVYPTGSLLAGVRGDAASGDTIDIVFNMQSEPDQARISYRAFASALAERSASKPAPLVYFDASCWGVEKAWFGLARAPASQLMEVASNSPANFFDDVENDAMRIALDGVMTGESFDDLRRKLGRLPGYASGREDRFVFPDDPLYPRAGALTRIHKRLFAAPAGEKLEPYTPDGYL